MKNYKLIPLLAMTAFLAGCNVNGKASSKVKFAKEGKEAEFADVYEVFQNPDLLGFWTNNSNNHASSAVIKGSGTRNASGKLISKKKVVESDKEVNSGEVTFKADMRNLRISVETKEKYFEEEKNELGGESYEDVYDESYNYQLFDTTETVVNGEEEVEENRQYFVMLDNKNKMYTYQQNVTNYDEIQKLDYVENFIYGFGNRYGIAADKIYEIVYSYQVLSVEQKAKYNFYQNGQIFTVTYEDQQSVFDRAPNGDVASVTTTTYKNKYQLDATNGESFKYVYEEKKTVRQEYYSDVLVSVSASYGGTTEVARFKGDVYESTRVDTFAVESKVQDVTIKEVDVSKYVKSNMAR